MFVHHQEQFCTGSFKRFTTHVYEESSRWHDTIDTGVSDWAPYKVAW